MTELEQLEQELAFRSKKVGDAIVDLTDTHKKIYMLIEVLKEQYDRSERDTGSDSSGSPG